MTNKRSSPAMDGGPGGAPYSTATPEERAKKHAKSRKDGQTLVELDAANAKSDRLEAMREARQQARERNGGVK